MPMMVINLGGEMMYILQQRLVAQNIPRDKVCHAFQATPTLQLLCPQGPPYLFSSLMNSLSEEEAGSF